MTDLQAAFSNQRIGALSDRRSVARGAGYAAEGRVERITVEGTRLSAIVRGTMPYRVELWVQNKQPRWSCTCPVGETGAFCKHCVATALAWGSEGESPVSRNLHREEEEGGIEEAPTGQVLGDQLQEEPPTTTAAAAEPGSIDLKAWRRSIKATFGGSTFISYRDTPGWARDVGDMIADIEDLLESGQPDAAAGLAEYAHRLADAAIQYVDDSDGWLTDISLRLGDLHLRACRTGTPDPIDLARRLVELELTSELDHPFHRAAATYADLLGDVGLAEYRRLVEPRYQQLPATCERFSTERFRLTNAMMGLAIASRDPDRVIAFKSGNLRTPGDYHDIASTLAQADRLEEAIEWVQRGLQAFVHRTWQTQHLRELLGEIHRQQGQLAEATAVFWEGFATAPSLESYRRLIQEADQEEQSDPWRQRALDHLRSTLEADAGAGSWPSPGRGPAGSVLVEVLLFEGELEDAWTAAQTHGCDDRLWSTLARAREKTHPEEAIPVFQLEVARSIERKKNYHYRQAVDLMRHIQLLHRRLDQDQEFESYVANVRAEHRLKRNLMELLRREGW